MSMQMEKNNVEKGFWKGLSETGNLLWRRIDEQNPFQRDVGDFEVSDVIAWQNLNDHRAD